MKGTEIGGYAPDFELPGTDGKIHHLAQYLEQYQVVCVVFMGNRCPYVRSYLERLKQLQGEFLDRGLTLIAINPNDATQSCDESFENMMAFTATYHLNFPYIRDVTQDVALCFGVRATPEVFLLDHEGLLRYRGQIDDNPNEPDAVTEPYLKWAIEKLMDGKAIELTETEPLGSSIDWKPQ